MKIELNRQELSLLLAWAEESTKGRFALGDDPSGLTYEENNLIRKLKAATAADPKSGGNKEN